MINMKINNSIAYVFVVLLAITLIILAPFAVIWALNTLFPMLAIPYTFETWLSIVVLSGVFKTTVTKK